jgi:hypothetical protein
LQSSYRPIIAQKLNKEVLIVVRDSENSEVILNSVDYTHVIVKSLIKTVKRIKLEDLNNG